MYIIIKNPAPAGEAQKRWGDHHFGSALAAALAAEGHVVTQHYYEDWSQPSAADLVIVLRGLHRWIPPKGQPSLLWIISHPAAVSKDECEAYDWVGSASRLHSNMLARRMGRAVAYLPQCTDVERFQPTKAKAGEVEREGLLYVANSRGVRRDIAQWAAQSDTEITVIGRGWDRFEVAPWVERELIDNAELPTRYGQAAAVLNDHWLDMKQFGYINNRIFDALACHAPVISDHFPALEDTFGDALLYARSAETFQGASTLCQRNLSDRVSKAQAFWAEYGEQFTFHVRAREILEWVGQRPGKVTARATLAELRQLEDALAAATVHEEQRVEYLERISKQQTREADRLRDKLAWEEKARRRLDSEKLKVVAARDKALQEKARLRADALSHVTRLEQEIVTIRRSTSWRLMAPLRMLSRLIKRLLGRRVGWARLPQRPATLMANSVPPSMEAPGSNEEGSGDSPLTWRNDNNGTLPPGSRDPADDAIFWKEKALRALEKLEALRAGEPRADEISVTIPPAQMDWKTLSEPAVYWAFQTRQTLEEIDYIRQHGATETAV